MYDGGAGDEADRHKSCMGSVTNVWIVNEEGGADT